MNYISIDIFGGIVTNADSEDIRSDIGQDNINFTIDKAGVLKHTDKYRIAAEFNNKLVSGVYYWTDFSFNDQKFIVIIDKSTNFLELLNNNHQLQPYLYFDNVDGSGTQSKLGVMNQPSLKYKAQHSFLSTGNYVRIASKKTDDPKILQYIDNRNFWGFWEQGKNWFIQKKLVAQNTEVYVDADDGFFLDIAYPRQDYARGRLFLSESSGDIDSDFTCEPVCSSSKFNETVLVRDSVDVTGSELVGNLVYESATVNTSFATHEYAIALVYDGNQIGPLSNSSYTRIKTVKPQNRARARGMAAQLVFEMKIATMQGSSTSEVRTFMQNPRVTAIAVYRSVSLTNFTKLKSKTAMRRIGTYRIDRTEDEMKRVSISSSNIQLLDAHKMLTIDSPRFASSIGGNITSTHFKYFWDSSGDAELEENSRQITAYDDVYGVYSLTTAGLKVPDYLGEWAICQNSSSIGGGGAGTIYNSGIKAIGGEMWIIVPAESTDGDNHFKNCIIQEQNLVSNAKFDVIVESYFGEHVKANGDRVFYHACRLAGKSLWFHFKNTGLINVWIYRTNEPIYWYHHHDNSDDSTNKTKRARIHIYDVDPISFEGHPYPEDKINHGYEVQHSFMGRKFAGNVMLNLGDDDEERHQNMVLYSEIGQFDVMPSANFIVIANEFGGEITGFSDMGADLLIFTTHTINFLNMRGSDPSSWTLSTVSNKIGCIASDSIIKVKDRVFFAGNDSCYYLSSTGQLVPISEPINDMYRGLSDEARQKTQTIYDADKGILYWQFGSSSTVDGSIFIFELHLIKGDVAWTKRTFNRPISLIAEDFNNKPAYLSSISRIDNPLAR